MKKGRLAHFLSHTPYPIHYLIVVILRYTTQKGIYTRYHYGNFSVISQPQKDDII